MPYVAAAILVLDLAVTSFLLRQVLVLSALIGGACP